MNRRGSRFPIGRRRRKMSEVTEKSRLNEQFCRTVAFRVREAAGRALCRPGGPVRSNWTADLACHLRLLRPGLSSFVPRPTACCPRSNAIHVSPSRSTTSMRNENRLECAGAGLGGKGDAAIHAVDVVEGRSCPLGERNPQSVHCDHSRFDHRTLGGSAARRMKVG